MHHFTNVQSFEIPLDSLFGLLATIATILPVGILMNVEAGRSGAKGPIRYPTLIGFVSIFLAISVSFPLVWVPSFLLFGGSKTGAVLPKRAYASLYLAIPGVVFTILAFRVDVPVPE